MKIYDAIIGLSPVLLIEGIVRSQCGQEMVIFESDIKLGGA